MEKLCPCCFKPKQQGGSRWAEQTRTRMEMTASSPMRASAADAADAPADDERELVADSVDDETPSRSPYQLRATLGAEGGPRARGEAAAAVKGGKLQLRLRCGDFRWCSAAAAPKKEGDDRVLALGADEAALVLPLMHPCCPVRVELVAITGKREWSVVARGRADARDPRGARAPRGGVAALDGGAGERARSSCSSRAWCARCARASRGSRRARARARAARAGAPSRGRGGRRTTTTAAAAAAAAAAATPPARRRARASARPRASSDAIRARLGRRVLRVLDGYARAGRVGRRVAVARRRGAAAPLPLGGP